MNTLDWAVQDDGLLKIRSHGNFNRTLPTMDRAEQKNVETVNYVLSFMFLLILAAIHQARKKMRKRHYARALLRQGQQ